MMGKTLPILAVLSLIMTMVSGETDAFTPGHVLDWLVDVIGFLFLNISSSLLSFIYLFLVLVAFIVYLKLVRKK